MLSTRPIIGVDVAPIERPRLTGTERYALEIVRSLLRHPRAQEFEWRLYGRTGDSCDHLQAIRSEAALGEQLRIVALGEARMWTHRRLGAEVSQRPPDVLFVPAHVLPVALPGRTLPPTVVTLHDVGFRTVPDGNTLRQRSYLEWSTRDSVARASVIIAVSQATADDLKRHYGLPADRVAIVHEAPSPVPPLPQSQMEVVRQQLGIARPYALFIGSIQPRKNLVRLAQAYAQIARQEFVEFDLILAGGDGWKAAPIHEQISALKMPTQIRFTGYIDDDERAALLRGARLFCYPSLTEGFGLPVLEAQSVGVPVLTANNSSLPEVAGKGALLVDPTDVDAIAEAMLRLSRDVALREQLIAAGHENVKRFSWEKAAGETLAVLESVARRIR